MKPVITHFYLNSEYYLNRMIYSGIFMLLFIVTIVILTLSLKWVGVNKKEDGRIDIIVDNRLYYSLFCLIILAPVIIWYHEVLTIIIFLFKIVKGLLEEKNAIESMNKVETRIIFGLLASFHIFSMKLMMIILFEKVKSWIDRIIIETIIVKNRFE